MSDPHAQNSIPTYCPTAGGAAGALAWAASPFTRSFSSLLGLKKGIFFAGTSTFSPVLGLRPIRGLRWRVRKLPKPRISILSPARNDRTTLSKIVSTITSLSLRVSSAKRETSSIKSAFVIVPLRSQPSVLRGIVTLGGDGLGPKPANSHNLLKFQGLYASHSFGTKRIRGSALNLKDPTPTVPLLPQIVESHLLLQHFLAPGDPLRYVAGHQIQQCLAIFLGIN